MKNLIKQKKEKKQVRKRRIRAKIIGTAQVPRLSVFRSNKHIYTQLIDDKKGITLASASDLKIKGNKKEKSKLVGESITEKALKLNIKKSKFDRGGNKYHGRIKILSEAVKNKGLKI
jgi:large subunit ribosomal protein L18